MIELARATHGSNAIEYSIVVGAVALSAVLGFRLFGESLRRTATDQGECIAAIDRGCVRPSAQEAAWSNRLPAEPTGMADSGAGASKREIAALSVATLRVALAISRDATEVAHVEMAKAFEAMARLKDLPNVSKIATTAGNRSTSALQSGLPRDFQSAAESARNAAWAYESVTTKAQARGLFEVAGKARQAAETMKELAASHETNRELSERLIDANSAYARATLDDDGADTSDESGDEAEGR